MLTRLLLLSALLLLTACKHDAALNNLSVAQLDRVQFEREGGPQCTEDQAKRQCATFKASYPQFSFADNPQISQQLNQFVQAQLLEYSDENGKQPQNLDELAEMFIAEYQQTAGQVSDWELERNVQIIYHNDPLLTLEYVEYGYTGGAHPFSGQNYSILDLNTGKALNLQQLLGADYQQALTPLGEKAFRVARQLSPTDSLEKAGFWFESNTFTLNHNAGITPQGLAFTFNPYEVGPYVLGPTNFVIPWAELQDVIPPDSPLKMVIE